MTVSKVILGRVRKTDILKIIQDIIKCVFDKKEFANGSLTGKEKSRKQTLQLQLNLN